MERILGIEKNLKRNPKINNQVVDVLLRGQDNLQKDPTNQCDVTKEHRISVKFFILPIVYL